MKKEKKVWGVPPRKASGSDPSGLAVRSVRPKKAGTTPSGSSRAGAQADPYGASLFGATPEEVKTVTAIMRPMIDYFKIIEDIDWSIYALRHLANIRNTLTAQEIGKNGLYHIKRIIRGKKKLGYDTSADEAKLVEFKALAVSDNNEPTKP